MEAITLYNMAALMSCQNQHITQYLQYTI